MSRADKGDQNGAARDAKENQENVVLYNWREETEAEEKNLEWADVL